MDDMGVSAKERQEEEGSEPRVQPRQEPAAIPPGEDRRTLVLSIHDVAPQTFPIVRQILADLDEVGIHRRTLLVVPRFHGEATLESDPEFREFLVSRDQDRDEICLHGFEHIARPREYHGLARLIATRYTDSEGEFYRLPTDQAVSLVERGMADMGALGIHPRGFVAPAWLHPRSLEPELRRMGFLYATRLWSFVLLQPEVRGFLSPGLVYSPRRRWRIAVSLMWNPSIWRLSWFVRHLRVVIHPCDWKVEFFRRQITGILRAASQRRAVLTYADLAGILGEEAKR